MNCLGFILCLVLVQPRKTCPNITEKLLTWMQSIKTDKQTVLVIGVGSFSIWGGSNPALPTSILVGGGGVLPKVHIYMRAHVCTHMC